MKIAERMTRIGIESAFEVLQRARALEAQGKKIVHLEIGQPDFPTPRHVIEAGKKSTIAAKNRAGGSSRSTSANVKPSPCRKSARSLGGSGRTTL